MVRPERQQAVLGILSDLKGLEPLNQLLWSELSYQRVNQPLFRRGWTESGMAESPIYLRQPFSQEPEFGTASVNFKLYELLEKALAQKN
jgi:hypothetical protein